MRRHQFLQDYKFAAVILITLCIFRARSLSISDYCLSPATKYVLPPTLLHHVDENYIYLTAVHITISTVRDYNDIFIRKDYGNDENLFRSLFTHVLLLITIYDAYCIFYRRTFEFHFVLEKHNIQKCYLPVTATFTVAARNLTLITDLLPKGVKQTLVKKKSQFKPYLFIIHKFQNQKYLHWFFSSFREDYTHSICHYIPNFLRYQIQYLIW